MTATTIRRGWCLGLLAGVLAAPVVAQAAASRVEDKGGMFSAKAVEEANRLIDRIYKETKPHKDVVVESVVDLPANTSIDQLAESRVRDRTVDGIVIVFAKNAKKLAVSVGPETEKKFGDKITLKNTIIEFFKKNKYDDGLVEGLKFAHAKLTAAFPPTVAPRAATAAPVSTPSTTTTTNADGGFHWIWIVVAIIGVWIVIGIIRAIFAPSVYVGGGGYGGPMGGYGGGYGGGGFGSSMLGGLFGGMAGAWMYNSWFGGGGHYHGGSYGAGNAYGSTPAGADPNVPVSDEGRVGSTTTGDWGDSPASGGGSASGGATGSDAGGGSWADAGGGGGSDSGGGGGDFGGGGGDSGGGGGGDW